MQPKSHFAVADLGDNARKMWFSCEKPGYAAIQGYNLYLKNMVGTKLPFTFAKEILEKYFSFKGTARLTFAALGGFCILAGYKISFIEYSF